MLNLPAEVTALLAQFAPLFTPSGWSPAQVLVVGAILAPGKRTVTAMWSVRGLRWGRVRRLVPIPWVSWGWALPFLTALAPSERSPHDHRHSHKKLTDGARQRLGPVRRWGPRREVIVVADSSFAVLTLLDALRHLAQPGSRIARLRLDAALYDPAPVRPLGQPGRPRGKGKRLPPLPQGVLAAPPVDFRDRRGLVARAAARGRRRVGDRRGVPYRDATGTHPLGGTSRSPEQIPPPSPAVYRDYADAHADCDIFRAPLAGGSHLSSRPHSSWRRNPTPVERLDHCSYDTNFARFVRSRHSARACSVGSASSFPTPGRLAHAVHTHICRRLGPGSFAFVAVYAFFTVP